MQACRKDTQQWTAASVKNPRRETLFGAFLLLHVVVKASKLRCHGHWVIDPGAQFNASGVGSVPQVPPVPNDDGGASPEENW